MGYDCTFHLVDENAIRNEFVPRLLGRREEPTALDRVDPEAVELWKTVRDALNDADPEEPASLVCQLALRFSACSLPHHYERGFALSLWDGQDDSVRADYPPEFVFSPEELFRDVVQAYPKLAGKFPEWFTGNYSTGVFVPAERVPDVLDWVEETVSEFSKGDRRQFKGLLRIMRTAAEKSLAYWEATDLAVPMTGTVAGDPALMTADYLRNEPGSASAGVEEAAAEASLPIGGTAVIGDWLVTDDTDPFTTKIWSLQSWPPKIVRSWNEFAPYHARSQHGAWLLLSEPNAEARTRNFRPRFYPSLDVGPINLPVILSGSEIEVRSPAFVRHIPVVFRSEPDDVKEGDSVAPPLWWKDRQWQPMPGLPDAILRKAEGSRYISAPPCGVSTLADGSEVLIWDGNGYELRDGTFVRTFDMKSHNAEVQWTSVPWRDDGFFYLSNRCLFEVRRGGQPIRHLPDCSNIMFVRPGPEGGILLREGDNPDGDTAKLYFPDAGNYIHIEPELFDDNDYALVYWNAHIDRFVVSYGDKFLAIPTSKVLSLPREHVKTNG
jgi:hypothetical protein